MRQSPQPAPGLSEALGLIGDRWSLLVVSALLRGPRRYGELVADVPGIAANVLAARLRRLESERLVTSRPYQERPVRLEYQLSAEGRQLADVLAVLESWGARRRGLPAASFHDACGTALEWRPYCPTCTTTVEPADTGGDMEWV